MSNLETPADTKADKPATLNRPLRKRIKKVGKRLARRIAAYQSRQSLVPDEAFVDNAHFPFLEAFEERWEEIAEEARAVLKFRDAIPGFQDISPDQYRLATEKNWRTFVLFGFGTRCDRNCSHAPVTAQMLARVPNIQTAWFSILAPGYHIPAHEGVTNGILRAHLGLIIPAEREKCRIRVGDVTKFWREGKVFVFDDTYNHEVWNDTDEERVVLLFDFIRPMTRRGRALNWLFVRIMKMTAFYLEPKRNIEKYEDRFEAAVRRADALMESMGETPR